MALIICLWLALQTTPVQNWLVGIATKKLSDGLGTTVSIKHVSLSFFNRADMEGVFIADKKKDTLLYAGSLKVRITDWFIFKDKADLKYAGLENATIKLQRTDSIWNYQFIADYFASDKPKQPKKKGGIILNLKKIDLKNITFINNDRWIGEEIITHINSLVIDAENINFDKGILQLNEVNIVKPFVQINNYTPNRKIKPIDTSLDTGFRLNPAHLVLQVKELNIADGAFIDNANFNAPDQYFDGRHLAFTKIKANFTNILLNNDTLTANMLLSCKERSGLEVKKLAAKYKVNPEIMEFDSLDLQTNQSKLTNYYAMRFKHFNDDFGDYENKVVMVANFKNSTVHTNDIALFAPDLASANRLFSLSGNFRGTVVDFDIKNLFAKSNNSSIAGNLSMKGLPDIDKTLITLNNGLIQTNATDVSLIAPALKKFNNPDIQALGNIIYRGNFKGYYNNFNATGNVSSNLGGFYTNLTMLFPKKGEPVYKGTLNAQRFNLGKFVRSSTLGYIDFAGNIDGTSFTLDKMKTSLNGIVKSFEVNGYKYTNITTNGTFEKREFYGELKVNDPNLDLIGSVQLDFSDSIPRFNLFADIVKSNYKELKLTQDDLRITGTLDFNFTGSNIDNFLGTAKLLNASIYNNGSSLNFDSLKLNSYFNDQVKNLSIDATDFHCNINGKFTILDLPASFQSFLHKYYPAYVAEPTVIPTNQNFNFKITTSFFEPYIQLVDKSIFGLNDVTIDGSINTSANSFNSTILVPYFKYKNYAFSGIDINSIGNRDSLNVNASIASTIINDSTRFPQTTIQVNSANDYSVVNIQTRATNTLNDASLVADVFTLNDGVRILFKPSSFVINDKKWNIEQDGEIIARKQFLSTKDLKLSQGYQEISVNTENEEETNAINVNLKLKKVVLGDFVGYALHDPKLEGLVTGKIKVLDVFNRLTANATLAVEQFRVDEDSIGIANIIAGYNSLTGEVSWNYDLPNDQFNIAGKGSYQTKDSTKANRLQNEVVLKNSKIKPIAKYLKGVFSNVDGTATGVLTINANDSLHILGEVTLRDAGLLVDYTQVYYTIDSAKIKFEKDGINFGSFTIKDKFGNAGFVKGKLYEQEFKNMSFDFDLNTAKLLLLDTKPQDNEQFYGTAVGKASLSFKGPETNAKMVITGEANDTSHIFIPNSTSKESSDADYIVFKQFGEEIITDKQASAFNLSVDLDLAANNKVAIDVILDDATGDVIKATGNGRLRIKAGTSEKLDIRGRYNIENGKYDFNFQSLIKKPFVLLPGTGNYIEWTGDAFNADIKIDARYEAENVNLGDLINNTSGIFGSNDNALRLQRGPVYVVAQLRDKLLQPQIQFKIDFPTNSIAKTDANFAQFLSRIESDNNEMLTQATSLIIFNAFAPYGQGLLGGGAGGGLNYTSLVTSTITQKLVGVVNKEFTGFLQRLFKDKSLSFDMGTSLYSSGNFLNSDIKATSNNRIDRSRFNFKFGKSFFNNNLIVTFGGDLDVSFGATAAQSGNLQWLPDLNIEVILSKDKKLRAIVFNKNSLDINGATFGRRNRQGISISFRQEFETIFGKHEEEYIAPTPVNQNSSTPNSSNGITKQSGKP